MLGESKEGKPHIQAVLILRTFAHLGNWNLVLTVLCDERDGSQKPS